MKPATKLILDNTYNMFVSVCLSVSLTLSSTHKHTHKPTHTQKAKPIAAMQNIHSYCCSVSHH